MPKLRKEDVILTAKELNVKSIRLQFMDVLGIVKNVAIPIEDLKSALDGEIMFDGSSIEGFVRIEESDMFLMPDPASFTILPWVSSERRVARLICDIYTPEGKPFLGCPRGMLKRVVEEAKEMGFEMFAGPEAEFFLFKLDGEGKPTTITNDQGGYFDLSPLDKGEDARRYMVYYLEEMGFNIEASHHEVAPGQHEIDFMYDNAITTADNIATFKVVVKTVAMQHGMHATFMPKPIFGINGSGMHTHQSLFKDGKNAFYSPDSKYQLSDDCLYYIGGLLHHAPGFTAVTNPLINSYKRLVPGYEAPVYIAWSERNRSPLVRIPAKRGTGTRVELRSPDPSCNPYLAFGVMLKAGLDGIKKKIMPPDPVNENIYEMTDVEKKSRNILKLPGNLNEAMLELDKNEVIKSALGEHILEYIKMAKNKMLDDYNTKVHNWELENYLAMY